jgi:uncharacterized protein
MGPWIETASGLRYHFLNPQQDEIDIQDIALALANKCRFSGHTQFYSVAEHSVCVAYRLPKHLRLAGLLHDASEAYLGDIPSPLKACLPDYRAIEKVNEAAIIDKFGVDIYNPLVKQADRQALYTEASYLIPSRGIDWEYFQKGVWHLEPEFKPQCAPPVVGYKMFIDAFREFSEDTTAKYG